MTAENVEPISKAHCSQCGGEVDTVGRMTDEELLATGLTRAMVTKIREESKELQRHMSPPGALSLPALLDYRRLDHGIPDEAFAVHATYERIFLWQLESIDFKHGTFGADSPIHAPQNLMSRDKRECPRCVVISAGCGALDVLRTNGMDLGHIVQITRIQPWKLRVGFINGNPMHILVANVGDITGSEDLRADILQGHTEILFDEEKSEHYINQQGKTWNPKSAWADIEY